MLPGMPPSCHMQNPLGMISCQIIPNHANHAKQLKARENASKECLAGVFLTKMASLKKPTLCWNIAVEPAPPPRYSQLWTQKRGCCGWPKCVCRFYSPSSFYEKNIRAIWKKTLQTTYSEKFLSYGWRAFETFYSLRSCRGRYLKTFWRYSRKDCNTLYGRFEKKFQ